MHEDRQGRPPVGPIVAEGHDARMLSLVRIDFWVEIIDAEFAPEAVDFVVVPGQKQPSRLAPEEFIIFVLREDRLKNSDGYS